MSPEQASLLGVISENNAVIEEGLRAGREFLEAKRSGDQEAIEAAQLRLEATEARIAAQVEVSKRMVAAVSERRTL